jgi:hypothetical protein
MADIKNIINELLLELSVTYPFPNMKDREQVFALLDICEELGYDYLKPQLEEMFLNEAEGEGESKLFPGKFHLGGGFYSSKNGGEAELKNEKGNLRPVTPEEKAKFDAKNGKGEQPQPTDEPKKDEPTAEKPVDKPEEPTAEKPSAEQPEQPAPPQQNPEVEQGKKDAKEDPQKVLSDPKATAQSKAMARAFKAQSDVEDSAKEDEGKSEPAKLEPINDDPTSKAKKFKGKKSGKEIQTIEMDGGGMVFGTVHRNRKMVDDIIDHVKATIPEERWKDIVFVGEGGATNDKGQLEFHDEMKYAAPKFKEFGAGIDTFDGDDLDVHNDQSKLYKRQKEKTGLSDTQVKAGNWASMIGQGEGTDTMSPNDYLDDEGKQFLQDAAKEAGLPPIEDFDNPKGEVPNAENPEGSGDIGTLYRLSFPEDNGDTETKVNDIQVAFNEIRDENLIEKNKELVAQGKIPITIAGEGHIELVDNMLKKGDDKKSETKAVEPEKIADEMPEANKETFAKDGKALDGIEPQQLEQFNTDISKVSKMIDDAKAKGEPAPNINLCDITIPGTNLYCDDNQGIPREEMPQFKGKAVEGSRAAGMETDKDGEVDTEPVFREMLKEKGIKVLQTEVPADKLKATQKDLVGEKVIGMMGALEKDPNHPKITAPIYVSRDGYVIDGHHRWAAIVAHNAKHPDNPIPMKTTVIDMDIKDAIPMANKFAEDMGIAAKKADAKDGELPAPKEPSKKEGGVIYPLGGGYYSDTEGGPAQYIKAESVVNKIFIEENIKFIHLLFEENVSKETPSGKEVMVKPIGVKDQPEATANAEDAKEAEDVAGNSSAKEFTKKSETTEGLFATKDNYKTVKAGDKEYTVRPLIDPDTGEPIDTASPEGRKRAIEITRKRLDDLKEKSKRAVAALSDKTLNKAQRQLIHKWLGEYGELHAYASLLESDSVKDVFLFTDSEVKNDILVIGKSDDERTIVAWGVSVKAAQQDTMANKRGSSVKPDFDKALDGADTRSLTLEGVSESVDAGVVMNSMLELRKQVIKKLSDGKVSQDEKTGSSIVKLEDGREVLITEFLREQKVTEDDIDEIFNMPTIQKAIRGLLNEKVDEKQAQELVEYFRKKFKEYVKGGVSIKDMEDKMIEEFVSIFDKVGANLTPSTDIMISYYNEDGFTENKFITKEDSEKKILDAKGVGSIEDISKVDQFREILGLDFTGRGAGKKKQGKGYVDGQSFGRPDKNLQPDPISLNDYISKHF